MSELDGYSNTGSKWDQRRNEGFWRVVTLCRRIWTLSEDPVYIDDSFYFICGMGLFLTNLYHVNTRKILVLGTGTEESHIQRKVNNNEKYIENILYSRKLEVKKIF